MLRKSLCNLHIENAIAHGAQWDRDTYYVLIMNFIKLPKSGPTKTGSTGLAPIPVLENDRTINVHFKMNSEQKDQPFS